MATIHNSEVNRELIRAAKIQQNVDSVPNQLDNRIIPVMECNPHLLEVVDVVKFVTRTNSTGGTIVTLDSDKDFYLCGAALSVIKDVTSTSTSTVIQITLPGESSASTILGISSLSLTPQSECTQIDFARPILLKRGSTITDSNSTAVANITSKATIYGYYVNNPYA